MNMKTIEACEVIQQTAPDAIYVTTMGAMNGMDKLEVDVLSVACVPLMGGAASLGLGIALARPDKTVLVLDGDASLLMELGGLVTVAQAPENFCMWCSTTAFSSAGWAISRLLGARSPISRPWPKPPDIVRLGASLVSTN
jgi:TPP-dependent trihydroxycyclohexane-1,2-dione (THcHDO) dehydratase